MKKRQGCTASVLDLQSTQNNGIYHKKVMDHDFGYFGGPGLDKSSVKLASE